MYWRKANQIHKWFIQNCAGGDTEKQTMPITREQIIELLVTVETILDIKTEAIALELLPPVSGFFFGSTDIDEYYWEDLENTKTGLKTMLKKYGNDWEFEYYASW